MQSITSKLKTRLHTIPIAATTNNHLFQVLVHMMSHYNFLLEYPFIPVFNTNQLHLVWYRVVSPFSIQTQPCLFHTYAGLQGSFEKAGESDEEFTKTHAGKSNFHSAWWFHFHSECTLLTGGGAVVVVIPYCKDRWRWWCGDDGRFWTNDEYRTNVKAYI